MPSEITSMIFRRPPQTECHNGPLPKTRVVGQFPVSALTSDTWWRAVGKRRNIWAKLAHAFLPWQAMLLLRLGRHLGPFSSFNDRQDLSCLLSRVRFITER